MAEESVESEPKSLATTATTTAASRREMQQQNEKIPKKTQTNLVAQPRTKEKRTKEPWRVPSRPHVSPPEARPQESSSPLRPRGSPPQPSEASRSLTGTDPEPSLFVRLEGTRSPPNSSSGSFPSRDSSGRSPRTSSPT